MFEEGSACAKQNWHNIPIPLSRARDRLHDSAQLCFEGDDWDVGEPAAGLPLEMATSTPKQTPSGRFELVQELNGMRDACLAETSTPRHGDAGTGPVVTDTRWTDSRNSRAESLQFGEFQAAFRMDTDDQFVADALELDGEIRTGYAIADASRCSLEPSLLPSHSGLGETEVAQDSPIVAEQLAGARIGTLRAELRSVLANWDPVTEAVGDDLGKYVESMAITHQASSPEGANSCASSKERGLVSRKDSRRFWLVSLACCSESICSSRKDK